MADLLCTIILASGTGRPLTESLTVPASPGGRSESVGVSTEQAASSNNRMAPIRHREDIRLSRSSGARKPFGLRLEDEICSVGRLQGCTEARMGMAEGIARMSVPERSTAFRRATWEEAFCDLPKRP